MQYAHIAATSTTTTSTTTTTTTRATSRATTTTRAAAAKSRASDSNLGRSPTPSAWRSARTSARFLMSGVHATNARKSCSGSTVPRTRRVVALPFSKATFPFKIPSYISRKFSAALLLIPKPV